MGTREFCDLGPSPWGHRAKGTWCGLGSQRAQSRAAGLLFRRIQDSLSYGLTTSPPVEQYQTKGSVRLPGKTCDCHLACPQCCGTSTRRWGWACSRTALLILARKDTMRLLSPRYHCADCERHASMGKYAGHGKLASVLCISTLMQCPQLARNSYCGRTGLLCTELRRTWRSPTTL